MSPSEAHATGSRAIWRQSWHEPNGRKESLDSRVACDPQLDLRSERSCEVKKARDVLRLPGAAVSMHDQRSRPLTYYETYPDVGFFIDGRKSKDLISRLNF